MKFVIFCLALLVAFSNAQESGRARLLVQKKVNGEFSKLNTHIITQPLAYALRFAEFDDDRNIELFASGKNFSVEIRVVNVGNGPALDVEVNDRWPTTDFTILEGQTSAKFESIPPNSDVSVEFTLKANTHGELRGFPAEVQYKPSEKDGVQIGFSTPMFNTTFFDQPTYERLTARHIREWTVFYGVFALSIVLPLFALFSLRADSIDGVPVQRN